MKRRTTFAISISAIMALLFFSDRMPVRVLTAAGPAVAVPEQTVTTVPLYRLYKERTDPGAEMVSGYAPGIHFYTTSDAARNNALQHNGYRDEGIAGYVLPQKAHGSVPLFHVSSVAINRSGKRVSDKHFYSTDKTAIDSAIAAGWKQESIVGYVAPPSNPMYGTTELYRLYNPMQIYNGKAGHAETGDDDNLYTTDVNEKETAIAQHGYKGMGIAAYLWTTPVAVALNAPAKPMPDLIVDSSSVEGTTVTAIIKNQGKHNISSIPGIDVMFVILERDGKQVFSTIRTLKGMSPGQRQPVTFDTLNHNLIGRNYQIRIDHLNKVEESDENNNNSAPTPLSRMKITVDPNSAGKLHPPSIAIVGRRDVGVKFNTPHVAYLLAVHNWDQYPAEQFQSTKGLLPSSPCGDTRMQARITIYQGGRFYKADCKALHTPQELKTLETVAPVLADVDEISVTLIDRLTNETYTSGRFAVGWYGVGDLLKTVGCKSFLGRASQYLCMSDKGFAACENLRTKGKPIMCTRAGKQS